MNYNQIACIADDTTKAQMAYQQLKSSCDLIKNPKDAQIIIVLGGDGFMLRCLHKYMRLNVPFYGINCGTVGFLMNEHKGISLLERLECAKTEVVSPLQMVAKTKDGKEHHALAVNEVSILRSSRQAANLCISVDDVKRIGELSCDGVLVATPAGSTAYNLSVHGPIIPLGAGILAVTPISPFRPRRWKGALLSHKAVIRIDVIDSDKRPVNAVADFTEAKDVIWVEVREEREKSVKLLFDRGHSLEDRIISEQFLS